MDRNELKNQALLERVSELATQYENRVADLRVEVTLQQQQLREAQSEIERLNNELVQATEAVTPDASDEA